MADRAGSAASRPGPGFALRVPLVFVVLAPVAAALHWDAPVVFACSALAIVPLAGFMGDATERLATRLGEGVGGLLNATFGNAAELILALVALRAGLDDVVQASLTGSIVGNLLLVLGAAMLAGGWGRERQTFDRAAATASATLLLLAALALVVPAVFHAMAEHAVATAALTARGGAALEHHLSLAIAVVLFAAYGLSLLFALRTHRHLYGAARAEAPGEGSARPALVLAVATALVAWMSELLVGAVHETARAVGLTETFVGVVIVAVVGNAAEHSTAVFAAIRNRMDLAIHIAVGSSLQIALFVAPLLVFASYARARGPLDLRFGTFEVLAVIAATVVTAFVSQDGESNWLEGAMLLAVYLVLAVAFFLLP